MPKSYKFSEEQIKEIEAAKKKNKNKSIDKRLEVLLQRARNVKREKISEKTGFSKQYITELTSSYQKKGIEAIIGNHYKGNHRNMSKNEEEKLLKTFEAKAEKGQIIEIGEIKKAYEKAIGRELKSHGQIYEVLNRHEWRKIMPRSKHSKSASKEACDASKKLTQ